MNVTLYIENPNESKTVKLDEELTIGRTGLAQLVLKDEGLSRVNTTIFRDDDEVLIVDESSLNGTFLNGERIEGPPRRLKDGDEIKIGSSTLVKVEIEGSDSQKDEEKRRRGDEEIDSSLLVVDGTEPTTPHSALSDPQSEFPNPQSNRPPMMLIVAGLMTVAIVGFALLAWMLASRTNTTAATNTGRPAPQISRSSLIPIRVIDPLGGEDENDIDDLIASWETEEDPLKAEDLKEIDSVSKNDLTKSSDLNVPIDFWKKQLDKAKNHGATGAEPAGLIPLPEELFGGNVSKQKAKLAELINLKGYKQPLDFGDLAQLRLEGRFLGELPMATESYVLDIGGSATGEEFSSFEFASNGSQIHAPMTPDSPKYKYLKQLADNFDGQKYDLGSPVDRKQMRIRLLRMYNKDSRKGFEDFTNAYYQQFKLPLRVTSLTRSMDYQIGLNKTNSNSFKVSGKGSLPPHTSGCAFDISRSNLTADEQNFLMRKLSELERAHRLDSLREGAANACFHSFIYPDGVEPTNLNVTIAEITQPADLAASFPFFGFFNHI